MDLRQHYQNYIKAINDGCRPGSLDPYVHEGIIHNDSAPMSIAEYAQIIVDSQLSFKNLNFQIESLVVDPEQDIEAHGSGNVAVLIKLSFQPAPGEDEDFYEHVFYRIDNWKIRQVWSMLDGAGLKWAEQKQNKN